MRMMWARLNKLERGYRVLKWVGAIELAVILALALFIPSAPGRYQIVQVDEIVYNLDTATGLVEAIALEPVGESPETKGVPLKPVRIKSIQRKKDS